MQLHKLTPQELDALGVGVEAEKARRERIRVTREFVEDRTKLLVQYAAEGGVLDFEDIPDGGHLPGQVVVFEGNEYRNVSGLSVVVPPGEVIDVWELLHTNPDEPGETDEEPDDPEDPDKEL
jgi:hypothetical protein